MAGSQRPVSSLVFGHNVFAAAQLLPQFGHFNAEGAVLLLQERGADGDLVLFEPTGVPRTLGSHVVLSATGPVPIVLKEDRERKESQRDFICIRQGAAAG